MKRNTELFGPVGTPRVVVVGCGFGGIAAGVKMKRAGIHSFTIFEKSEKIGGTWWDNQYPGAEVDVASHVYSFPFKRFDWSRTHAKQAELQGYLEAVMSDWGLWSHLRLGVAVDRAEWNESTHTYSLTLDNGETLECDVLMAATGFLNVPRYPTWPGLDEFERPKWHTSRWEHEHDLTGKTVAVVGTGSTATQIIPEIAPIVKRVYLFQREPGWVSPKGDYDYTPEQRAQLANPLFYWKTRLKEFRRLEKGVWAGGIYRPGHPVNQMREAACREYIDREFADHPELRKAVTPNYPYPGKRPIFNSTFYGALKLENVELVPRAVESVTRTGVVDVDGIEREVDYLVMATGFQPTNYLARIEIVGRSGRTLREYWDGEPRAFLGITVPEFPNFYILYGPGTNGGEIVSLLQRQSEYAVRCMKRMTREGLTAIEVKKSWADIYHAWLQSTMEGTSWTMSNNYFTTADGKIVTQWPYGALLYGAMSKVLGRPSERGRRRSAAT